MTSDLTKRMYKRSQNEQYGKLGNANRAYTPEQIAKAGTEHAHQAALFCWANQSKNVYPELMLMFAIPNGGERNKIVASRLKVEGVKSGALDVFLPVARMRPDNECNYLHNVYHGLFIEMKKPNVGRLSVEQHLFAQQMQGQGYPCAACWNWHTAMHVIVNYLECRPLTFGFSEQRDGLEVWE